MDSRIPIAPPAIKPVNPDILRPLWSVMIPAYNCIDYIRETLESVLSQDLGPEIMQIEVIDDCSTDGDVSALVKETGNGRVQFFRQEVNKGSLRNFETCINRAKGHYVHILHGDDCVRPGFYKEIDTLLNNYPQAGAAFTNFSYIDHLSQNVNIINASILNKPGIIPGFLNKIAQKQLIQPPAIVVKRSVYEAVGSFYAVHFGEDWEMWTRIASKYPVAYSPKYLASYRVGHGIGISHGSFLTGQNILDISKVISIIQNYLPPEKQAKLKKKASAYYAVYCIRIANSLLSYNKEAAIRQAQGALSLSKSPNVLYWALRFYLMYLFRYKQIEKMLLNNGKEKFEKNVFSFFL